MIRTRRLLAGVAALLLLGCGACGACGACGGGNADESTGRDEDDAPELQVLVPSGNQAVVDAVDAAVTTWAQESGREAVLTPAADPAQQVAQGFQDSNPPDVFPVASDLVGSYVAAGRLTAPGADLPNLDDVHPFLRAAFTVDGTLACAPAEFSTLALVLDRTAWTAAGLTDADVPTTWDQLAAVAQRLTTDDRPGLVTGSDFQQLGVFTAQAGGALVTDGRATANSPAMVAGLDYVKSLLANGSLQFPTALGVADSTEAFGTGQAAMTIAGNSFVGLAAAAYPSLTYRVVPLPAGPAGSVTLASTGCWGIAAGTDQEPQARQLVEALTSIDAQLALSQDLGAMPSPQSAAAQFRQQHPEQTVFLDAAADVQTLPTEAGVTDVVTGLDSRLAGLADSDPQQLLDAVQADLEATLAR